MSIQHSVDTTSQMSMSFHSDLLTFNLGGIWYWGKNVEKNLIYICSLSFQLRNKPMCIDVACGHAPHAFPPMYAANDFAISKRASHKRMYFLVSIHVRTPRTDSPRHLIPTIQSKEFTRLCHVPHHSHTIKWSQMFSHSGEIFSRFYILGMGVAFTELVESTPYSVKFKKHLDSTDNSN
jgi:hypothetical protein